MSRPTCTDPIELPALIEYWLDELDPAATARIDEHIIACGPCSERLAEIVALSNGIRSAFREGFVRAFVTGDFVARLVEQGVRVREYRVARNGSVDCSVAPEDQVAVGRLEAPLQGVFRLDVVSRRSTDMAEERIRDIPFAAVAGEVVIATKIALLRASPAHQHRIGLIAVDNEGEQLLGEYIFNHSPHERAD